MLELRLLLLFELMDVPTLSMEVLASDWLFLLLWLWFLSPVVLWAYNFNIFVKLLNCLFMEGFSCEIKRDSLIDNLYRSVASAKIVVFSCNFSFVMFKDAAGVYMLLEPSLYCTLCHADICVVLLISMRKIAFKFIYGIALLMICWCWGTVFNDEIRSFDVFIIYY